MPTSLENALAAGHRREEGNLPRAGDAGDLAVTAVSTKIGPLVTQIGLLLLWASAIFTIYTGYDYFRAGIHHLEKEDAR